MTIAAQDFFEAYVFWDNKRPITIDLLRRLDLIALARQDGSEDRMKDILDVQANRFGCRPAIDAQAKLFDEKMP